MMPNKVPKYRYLLIHLLLIVGFLSITNSAYVYGGDAKVYPAFMCVENGAESGDFNRSMYRITRVKGSGSGILLCPIIRDSIEDSSGRFQKANVVQVKVNTFRTDPAPKIRLTLRKFNYKGILIQEHTKYPLGGHQSTFLQVKYKKDEGYYMLEVEMGVNKPNEYSKIFSYTVNE